MSRLSPIFPIFKKMSRLSPIFKKMSRLSPIFRLFPIFRVHWEA